MALVVTDSVSESELADEEEEEEADDEDKDSERKRSLKASLSLACLFGGGGLSFPGDSADEEDDRNGDKAGQTD